MGTHELDGIRALVTGGGGFIGARLVAALQARGATVTLTRRPGDGRATPGARALAADLSRPGEARAAIEDARPEVVFNLAGYGVKAGEGDEAAARALNADLPVALAEALLRAPPTSWRGLRLVHAGSALEYGLAGGDLREGTLPQPHTSYGRTKLAGAEAVIAAAGEGLPAVVARLFNVYGPGEQPEKLLPTLLAAADSQRPIPLTAGAQRRDFVYVDDAVEGLLRLACAPPGPPVVNLATGALTPVRSFALEAAAQLDIPLWRLDFGALPTRGSEMAHDPVAVGALRARLGWLPATTVPQGIARTLAAHREAPRG